MTTQTKPQEKMKQKLSKRQQELVDLLKTDEWEFGVDVGGWDGGHSVRCQKGGLGRGGEARYFSKATFRALRDKGLLKNVSKSAFGTRIYKLID